MTCTLVPENPNAGDTRAPRAPVLVALPCAVGVHDGNGSVSHSRFALRGVVWPRWRQSSRCKDTTSSHPTKPAAPAR